MPALCFCNDHAALNGLNDRLLFYRFSSLCWLSGYCIHHALLSSLLTGSEDIIVFTLGKHSVTQMPGYTARTISLKGARALRGYFGPSMKSNNKSCSSQVTSFFERHLQFPIGIVRAPL